MKPIDPAMGEVTGTVVFLCYTDFHSEVDELYGRLALMLRTKLGRSNYAPHDDSKYKGKIASREIPCFFVL